VGRRHRLLLLRLLGLLGLLLLLLLVWVLGLLGLLLLLLGQDPTDRAPCPTAASCHIPPSP
jgi:hypothetical protein